MSQKLYKSNISPRWPIERQDEVIAKHFANKTLPPEYQDIVKPYKRKPECLAERVQLLRPSTRNKSEDIVVASLACLALDADDLLYVLTQAGERDASVIDISAGITLKPKATSADLAKASAAFASGRAADKTIQRGKPGGDKSGEVRKAEKKAACMLIKDRWHDEDYETSELLKEAGVSYVTAVKHLDPRPQVIRNHKAAQKRKDNKAKREAERANA